MEFLKLPTIKNSFSYTRLFIYLAIVLTNFSYLPVFVNSFGNKATVILWTVLIIFLFFRFLVYERKISPRFVFVLIILYSPSQLYHTGLLFKRLKTRLCRSGVSAPVQPGFFCYPFTRRGEPDFRNPQQARPP